MSSVRRLTAILAADVAGYSRLMGADEEGTHERLKAHRRALVDPKITEHHGRIVNTTGDGMLVEFPSVVDAVRCAVDVQRRMFERNSATPVDERIEFRVGINLGDVIVEGGDIYGDGVNIAARLEALAEPGGICVSRVVRDQVRDRLDFAFEDMGEQQVKNIARRVRAYRIPIAENAVAKTQPPLPDKPSIAVLPFQNMSGDPEQEYFTDGMVEEITTAISRLPWLFVIARNSSFTYKGKAIDVTQAAGDLGVRYVLEGSVRKAANRVRITGQLIDTTSGAHIWADRFDGALDDIFELQDQVASDVVGAIEPRLRLSEIEKAARKRSENLNAYDLYLRALAQLHGYSQESMRKAITLLRQALAIDPSYAPAGAMLGFCRALQRGRGWEALSEAEITEALYLARQALEIGKDDPDALWMAGDTVSILAHEHATAAGAIDRALRLNPNSAHGWMARGWVACCQNQPRPAIEALKRAVRLSPLDPLGYFFSGGLALAHLSAGEYEEALEWADPCFREYPRYLIALRIKVVCCAHLGRTEEAQSAVRQLLDLDPRSTIARFGSNTTGYYPPPIVDAFVEGFRKAGLPEE
jgi:TolB-like protein/class 3 adenylate cyclase/tetratricopeptide (TPR) repeat protein